MLLYKIRYKILHTDNCDEFQSYNENPCAERHHPIHDRDDLLSPCLPFPTPTPTSPLTSPMRAAMMATAVMLLWLLFVMILQLAPCDSSCYCSQKAMVSHPVAREVSSQTTGNGATKTALPVRVIRVIWWSIRIIRVLVRRLLVLLRRVLGVRGLVLRI